MKKHLQILALLAALVLPWAMQAQVSIPYTQGFESSSMPTGWTHVGSGTAAPYSSSSYAHGGSYSLKFSGATADNVVVLPEFTSQASTLEITLWMRPESFTNTSCGSFDVGYVTDATSASSFVAVETFAQSEFTALAEKSVALGSAPANARIALRHRSNSTAWYWFVDDVDVHTMPTCPKPIRLSASNVTAVSADLTWVENGSATAWVVEYADHAFVPGASAGTTINTTDTTTSLTGLTANTLYYFAVRSDCGSGDTSLYTTATFRTPCVALTSSDLPYIYGFEDATGSGAAYAISPCWTRLTNSATAYPYPSATTPHSGTKSLYFYSTATYYSCAVMPAYADGVENLQVRFWSRASATTYTGTVQVGVMTDPTDISTFQLVATTTNVAPTNTWAEHLVNLSTYTGTGTYIAFRNPNTATSYVYLDDVSLELIPACPRVENMAAENISATSADIHWTEMGTGTSWTVEYGPAGFTLGGTTSQIEYAYDTTITLTNLTANTAYDVYVTVDCGSDVGGTNQMSFRTACTALDSLPYTQTFENEATTTSSTPTTTWANCWTLLNNGTSYMGYPYIANSTTYNHTPSGSKGLYWYGSITAGTYGDYQCIVFPAVDTDLYAINTLQVTFWAKASSTSYSPVFQVGVMSDPTDISTFQQLATINVGGNTTWTEYTTALGTFTGNGQYVAIKAVRPASTWTAYVDDITLEMAPTCPDITDISAVTTASSALLSWEYDHTLGVTPAGYVVEYRYANDSLATPVSQTVNSNQLLLTGLDPDSTYEVAVSVDCGAIYGAAETFTFHMQALPCVEWDTTGTGGASSSTATYPVLTSGTTTTDVMPVNGQYIYSYANHLYLASEINSGAVYLSGIDFQYAGASAMVNTTNCSIYLCHTTMTTCDAFAPAADLQLVYVGPMNCTTGWNHFEFNRGTFAYNGTSNLMVAVVKNGTGIETGATFYYTTASGSMSHRVYRNNAPYTLADMATATAGNSVWRPNMRLTTGGNGGYDCLSHASCAAPMAVASNVTGHTVSLRWIPGYQETSWDVDYRAAGASAWTSVASGTSTDSITITGLNATTSYEVRVGAVCSDTTLYSVVTFTTPCDAISVPFTETFETYGTGTTAFPTCWVKKGSTADRPYIHATTSYGHNNTHGLYFYAASAGYCYAVMPPTVNSVDSLQVSFWARQYSANYNSSFVVGVMTDPDDISSFVAIDTVHPANATTYELFEVPLNSYAGTGRYIAFSSILNSGTAIYLMLDDVTVDYIPTCPRITTANTRNVTQNEATIYWNYNLAYDFQIEYGPAGFTPGQGTIVTSTEDSIRLLNLSPSTAYDAYISAICSAGDTSNAAQVSFNTACGLLSTLPYFTDFESVPAGTSSTSSSFVNCWGHLNNGTSYGGYPYVYANATYNHTPNGAQGLYWYATTTTGTYGDYYCIALPAVDTTLYPTNTLQLDFWAKTTSASYNPVFYVGVMSDPTNINSFQPVDTISFNTTAWTLYEVPLTSFTGIGSYVAIKAVRPTSAWYAAVDDITLREAPSCFHPTDAVATTVTCTSAMVHWTPGDLTHTDFVVRYGQLGCNVDTCQDIFVQNADSLLLTGLDTGTFYDFYVATLCSDGDTTPWETVTFRTLAGEPVSSFPYSCTFAGTQGNSWELAGLGQTNQWYVGTAAYSGTADNMGLYVSNDNGATNSYTNSSISYSWAYRTMSLTAGEYAYSFDWRCNGESSYDYVRPFVVPAAEALTGGQLPGGVTAYTFATTAGVPAGWIDLANRTSSPYVLNLQSTWQTHTGTFTITQPGTYNLVFCWANDGSGGATPPAAIDNIYINRNTCPQVVDLAAGNVTADSMFLSWGSAGTETSWRVELDSAGVVTTFNVTDSSLAIGGLSPNTEYTVRVYANCGAGDTSMASTLVLNTPCTEMAVPYTENFDSYTGTTSYSTGVYPNCWDYVLNGSASYQAASYQPFVYTSTTYAHSGSNTLRLYGVGYFSLPPMNVPLDSLQLSFWNYTTSTYYGLEVGVMEGNTFVPIQDVTAPAASTHVQTTVYFAQYTGSSRIIAFRNYYTSSSTTGYSYNYLDDIQVSYAPTCMPVSDIVAVGASTGSIDVDWTDNSTASSWEVRCALGSAAGTTVTTMSHPVTITGLDTLTTYNVYVRPICSAGDTGEWSDAARLMTSFCDNSNIASTGNATATSYMAPVNNYYKYTLSETIIDSAELGGPQDFSAISYYYSYATAMSSKTNVDIYLQPTTKTTFSSSTDVVALDTATAVKVYSGALNCQQGWNIFAFDTTFSYDGTGNLLVIVDDNSNSYNSSSYVWGTSACTGNKTLYYYSDSYNPDVMAPASFSGTKAVAAWRPTMQLISCGGASCRQPAGLTATATTYQSASVAWTGNGASYEVALLQSGMWSTETAVTGTTHTFTGLQPATTYTFRVRQDCSVDSLGYSEWTTGTFTTDSMPCFAPTNFQVQSVTGSSATFGWTAADASHSAWEIMVYTTIDTTSTVVTTNPATITGLQPGLTYYANIRTLCGDAHNIEGMWADSVITFTLAACPAVTGLDTVSVSFNQVVLSWTADPLAQSWIVEYGILGFNQGSGTTVTVTAPTATITGLTDELTYSFYVKTVCGTNWESESWQSITVTTDEAPLDVVNVTALANNNAWGTVTGGGSYAEGSTVTLTAIPAEHCEFLQWADGVTANPRTVVVNTDTTFIANFAQIPQYTITVDANDAEMGTVAGGGQYYRGETATLTATANEGYAFQYWNDGNTDNPRTITVTADAAYIAMFASDSAGPVVTYTVTLTVNDETMGTVTGAGTYVENSSVTIAAIANNGYRFVTWSDGNTDAERIFAITSDVTLEATFEQNQQEGIDDVNGALTCTVYPNPAHNTANISVSGVNGQVRIMLLDMSGRTVASETMECSADCVKSMDVDGLAAGTYFVRVVSEQASMVQKLIVR